MLVPGVSYYDPIGFYTNSAVLNVEYRLEPAKRCAQAFKTETVKKSYAKWIEFLYGPIFKVIGFFYRAYTANRRRIEVFKANEKVSAVLKLITVLLLAGWILTWWFASDESRNRLTDEVKQSIGGIDSRSAR